MSSNKEIVREELKKLRMERRELVDQYGNMAQRHPMHVSIGGLNPAAQRLYYIRKEITRLELSIAAPKATVTPIGNGREWKQRGGLMYNLRFQGYEAKAGRSQGGGQPVFYVVENQTVVLNGFKTINLAVKAFERLINSR